MPTRTLRVAAAIVLIVLASPIARGQQTGARRDYDAEIRAAIQAAKDASQFDFLGTLVRTCLLPQSGGENNTDVLPNFVSNPASVSVDFSGLRFGLPIADESSPG